MVQYRARPGDIVVSKINARKKAVGIVPPGSDIGITIHFRSLIPDSASVDPLFLWLVLRSEFCVNQFDVETGGIGKGEISEERLLSIDVPVPPIETQRAILAQWRKAQAEIAVAQERIRKIEAEIEEQLFADLGLKAPTKVKPPKCFTVCWHDFLRWSVNYNQAALTGTEITKGKFPVVELGSILRLVQYGTSEKANNKGVGVPVLRMSNIKDGVLALAELKHIGLPEREGQRLLLQDGDILFNRTNSKDLVGKCAVFHEQGKYVFASYLIRIRTEPERAGPDYVSFILNSPIGRKQIDAMSRQIIGQANINSEELRSLQLPLPSLELQGRIMEHVGAGRARIAREREVARETARRIEADLEAWLLGTKKIDG